MVSNSLDPDQAQQNIGPDLGPNCLQSLARKILTHPCGTVSFTIK